MYDQLSYDFIIQFDPIIVLPWVIALSLPFVPSRSRSFSQTVLLGINYYVYSLPVMYSHCCKVYTTPY